jgi:hypothetical protein
MLRHWRLQREFDRRKPWVTQFVIDGRTYGGQYDPRTDPRMEWFLQAFPTARTVLDLGALEGAQSFRLAQSATIENVLGLEVRPAYIDKAEFVSRLPGMEHKVSFARANLESADLASFGQSWPAARIERGILEKKGTRCSQRSTSSPAGPGSSAATWRTT